MSSDDDEFRGISSDVLDRLDSTPEMVQLIEQINTAVYSIESDGQQLPRDIIYSVTCDRRNITLLFTGTFVVKIYFAKFRIGSRFIIDDDWVTVGDLLTNLKSDAQLEAIRDIAKDIQKQKVKQLKLLRLIDEYTKLYNRVLELNTIREKFLFKRENIPTMQHNWKDIRKALPFTIASLEVMKRLLTEE